MTSWAMIQHETSKHINQNWQLSNGTKWKKWKLTEHSFLPSISTMFNLMITANPHSNPSSHQALVPAIEGHRIYNAIENKRAYHNGLVNNMYSVSKGGKKLSWFINYDKD